MKKSTTLVLQIYAIVTFSLLCMMLFPAFAYAQVIVFENVNVIPMDKEVVLKHQRVVARADKILTIEPVTEPLTTKPDKLIDATGLYMLPGLSDTHFHQHGESMEEPKLQFTLLIANGITSVRSMAEWHNQDTIAIRNYANAKETLAPYYTTTGPQVNAGNTKSVGDAIKMVNKHKQRGYDYIKIHGNLEKETYLALMEHASKLNIPVVGHAQRKMPLEYSLRMKSLAHSEELVTLLSDEEKLQMVDLTPELAKQVATQVKDSGLYITPTLSILNSIPHYVDDKKFAKLKNHPGSSYLNQGTIDYFSDKQGDTYRGPTFRRPDVKVYINKLLKNNAMMTQALYEAKVPLLVGTDNFGFQITGFSIHKEMYHMVKAGMSEFDVLKAATVTSARYMSRLSQAGTISEGKLAEFVLLRANPLDDIRHSNQIAGVMLKGQYLDRQTLDKMLAQVREVRER